MSEVPNSRKSRRILVVDDDPHIRRMIIAALKRSGPYEFYEASNGREALDCMRAIDPSVVVLDLMMPVMSGWDVLQERSRDSGLMKIPVIIVSANRDPALAEAVDKGICAFLPKPFDIGVLTTLVRGCIDPSGDVMPPAEDRPRP